MFPVAANTLCLLALLSLASASFFDLQPEDRLKSVTVESQGKADRKLFFRVQSGASAQDSFEVPLAIDFEENLTFVGDKSKLSWGIVCKPEYCKALEPTTCVYKGVEFACVPADLTAQIVLDEKLASTPLGLKPEVLRIHLILEDKGFPRDGVLGLAPGADFYKAAEKDGSANGLTFNIVAPQGGLRFLDFEVYYSHAFSHQVFHRAASGPTWEVAEGALKIEGQEPIQGVTALNSINETFFNFASAVEFCNRQAIAICLTIDRCDDKTADWSKAPAITFLVKGQPELRVAPQEYLVYNPDDKRFDCRLGEPQRGRVLEFGLKLFQKFAFSVHFQGKERYLVLENEFEPVRRRSLGIWLLIGGLSLGILVCLGLIVRVEREHSRIKIA